MSGSVFLSGFSSVSLVKCQLKCTLNERRELKMIHFQWYSSKIDPYIKNQMGGFTFFQCRIMVHFMSLVVAVQEKCEHEIWEWWPPGEKLEQADQFYWTNYVFDVFQTGQSNQ